MKKIIVITRPDCIACRMLRYELKKRDIPYDALDTGAATDMFNMPFHGAPITQIIDYSKRPYDVQRFNGYGKITFDRILKEVEYKDPYIPTRDVAQEVPHA